MSMELKRRGWRFVDEDDKKKGKGEGRKVFLASGRCAALRCF
jgi:hypothetical protein